MRIYDVVKQTHVPNYVHARIPLPYNLNINAWRIYLKNYDDHRICDYLEYGWPLGYVAPCWPAQNHVNHNSALAYPDHVNDYITQEVHVYTRCASWTVHRLSVHILSEVGLDLWYVSVLSMRFDMS